MISLLLHYLFRNIYIFLFFICFLFTSNSFKSFRTGENRVLISSNVTARGIDIQQVSVVINFDLPKCIHTYLHRIGRSGRWGRKGVGINFITRRDVQKLKEIEMHYACEIQEMPSDIDSLKLSGAN